MQSPRLSRLLSALTPAALAEFWAGVSGPLVEPCDDETVLVSFLWRGQAVSTRVRWGLDLLLERAPGTDLWHVTARLPAALRTVYHLTHDDAVHPPRDASGAGPAHIDPVNPRVLHFPADPTDPDDYHTYASVLELPAAPPDPWSTPRPGVPAGTLTEAVLPGVALGSPRTVAVYRPAGTPSTGLPVLVAFDGFPARRVLRIPAVLDNLIAAGAIPPMVALFVSSVEKSREQDLTPTPPIHIFIERELMPWARETLEAGTDRRGNVIAGVSLGGLAASYVGLCAHELFGGVIAQSASFWWPNPTVAEPQWLIREVAQYPHVDVRFYLDVGVNETAAGPGGAPDQVTAVRGMRDALTGQGYDVTYAEYVGGHDYVNWRRTFADGLIAVARL
ncbi:alpha/beta hydrolase [Actinoplanes subtropicus]|uniref:alpha/beta hydrolase n=1 Tax=Actinoplanes subtropicus TaxID=543632 RepID=UPI0004C2C60B|nr:alpha/beta hydrolase-fold protein [Actinoplanes subtropicus]